MKRLLFTLIALVAFASAANATVCLSGATPAGSATLKDAAASPNTFIAPYTDTGDSSGNCWPQISVKDGANVTLGAKADAAWTSGSGSVIAILKNIANGIASAVTSLGTIATNTGAAIPAGSNLIGNTGQLYPAGSTPITASATGTTTATTATLAASASIHTYICGFSIRANAAAAATNNATVTGTVTGTMNFTQWTAPNASGLGVTEEVFSPCVISSAVNTGIAVVSGAPGTSGVVSVSAWGYQL